MRFSFLVSCEYPRLPPLAGSAAACGDKRTLPVLLSTEGGSPQGLGPLTGAGDDEEELPHAQTGTVGDGLRQFLETRLRLRFSVSVLTPGSS